jgi:hypothetical protein
MTSEQFDQVMTLLKVLGLIAGGVVAIAKFFEYMKARDKLRADSVISLQRENSVGAEAIKKLQSEDLEIRKEIEKLKDHESDQDEDIEALEKHYDNLIQNVWTFLKK